MNQEDDSNHLPETPIMQLLTHILAPVQREQVTERWHHVKTWGGKKISLEQTSTPKTKMGRKRQGRVKVKKEKNAEKKWYREKTNKTDSQTFFAL